jgi:hypothetical protein
MSISTGGSRRSAPKKSTTAAGGANANGKNRAQANGKNRTPAAGASTAKANGAATDSSEDSVTSAAEKNSTETSSTEKSATATKAPVKSTSTAAKSTSTPAKSTATTKTASSAKTASAKTATATKPKVQSALVGGGKRGSALTAGKGGGRRPVTPVRVAEPRNWGPILLFTATGLVALAIIGVSLVPVIQQWQKGTWREQVAAIPGLINYLDPDSPSYDASVTSGIHQAGDLTYPMTPPVGGPHNGYWQNCMGDVYTAEIAEEHAVHSLEHGAVWITYRPDLPQDQIDKLARRVEGREFMLMSPYPNQDAPISLQAWGYQLKVDNADDSRIDDFISALRLNASQEEGASCSGGITEATKVPLDFGEGMS